MAKYTYGLAISVGSLITKGILSTGQDFATSCKLKSSYNLSKLTDAGSSMNRSINGMYYALGKMTKAVMPFAQTETCLICANDATINNYYTGGNLKVSKTSFDAMLSTIGKAANDFNNALVQVFNSMITIVKSEIVDLAASASNCSSIIDKLPEASRFCADVANCTTLFTKFWSNTLL